MAENLVLQRRHDDWFEDPESNDWQSLDDPTFNIVADTFEAILCFMGHTLRQLLLRS